MYPPTPHPTPAGYYLHLEASALLPGRSVRLLSRPLRGSRGPQCLHFYYNMYGSGTGQLRVLLRREGGDVLLWQRSGEQSIAWLRGALEYQCDGQHQARVTQHDLSDLRHMTYADFSFFNLF